jgi:chromate transporter
MSATEALHLSFSSQDWWNLFLHYLSLSLLSVGGAITTVPEMHRFLVDEQHWLTQAQFSTSITLAQAAPGPNVLFIALLGWNIGLNTGGPVAGLLGVLISMTGIMLPSTTLTYLAAQWGQRNRELRAVRAFKQGMAPIVIALLVATGFILARSGADHAAQPWPVWGVAGATMLIVWRSRMHLLWLLGIGAWLGWLGLV